MAEDWPQWLGPKRDSVWREQGIVEQFPAAGLVVKWRKSVSWGYAGPSVAEGKVYVMDYVRRSGEVTNNAGRRDKLEGVERVLCFQASDGKALWQREYERPYNLSYPRGPRCTPTVESGKVYALGAEGDLLCLDAEDGEVLWSKELTKEYETKTPMWGFAAHPLVHGDLLFCLVGGEGSVAVAFNKDSGREVWRALSAAEPGYCPPTLVDYGGAKQLLIWHPESLNSLDPQTGKLYWSVPLKPDFGMSIAPPRQSGPHLFASAIRATAALLKLDDSQPAAQVVWRGNTRNALYTPTATPFLDGEVIYGCNSGTGTLIAARLANGERLWETAEPVAGTPGARNGTVFLVKHRDRFFLFSETGDLILARLTPERYEEISRFRVLEPTNYTGNRKVVWSHPAFAGRCVFARNDEQLVCVNLAAE
jgi:outer membrane protein assembly factor BamB